MKNGKPAYFYKYYSFPLGDKDKEGREKILNGLRNRALWASHVKAFNDPFEYFIDVSNEATLEELQQYQSKHLPKGSGFLKKEVFKNGKFKLSNELKFAINETGIDSITKAMDETGVFCMSGNPNDILMWGHYADGHRGFCLQFDAKCSTFSTAKEMTYAPDNKRPIINAMEAVLSEAPEIADKLFTDSICTKSKHWEYEDEWRLFTDIENACGKEIHYPTEALLGIIWGWKTPDKTKELIREAISNKDIACYQAEPIKDLFKIFIPGLTETL